METKSIEERARNEVYARFSAFERHAIERAVDACIEVATEQDHIARAEERERCIKAACAWIKKNTCTLDMECMVCEIRKAMEGGNNDKD